jgi:hypothetical protein
LQASADEPHGSVSVASLAGSLALIAILLYVQPDVPIRIRYAYGGSKPLQAFSRFKPLEYLRKLQTPR